MTAGAPPAAASATTSIGSKGKSTSSAKDNKIPRGRRERPCDACRRRKSKCVTTEGQSKTCAACGVHGQECTYLEDPQPRKRRLDNEGKDSDLPKRRSVSGNSAFTERRSKNSTREAFAIKTENESNAASISPSTSPPESASSRSQHHGTHIGYTTELEPMLFDLSPETTMTSQGTGYQKTDERNAFLIPEADDPASTETNYSDLQQILQIVGSHASTLIQVFCSVINRSLPIVPDTFFDFHGSSPWIGADPALLATVFALAAMSHTKAVLCSGDVEKLEEIGFRSFGVALLKPTLSTVQAGILLMQCPDVDSKTLNTQLVGVAYELGLHLDCSSWSITREECMLRRRLAWALYTQDKWCSLIHGRPSLISKDHWGVVPLNQDDFPKSETMDEQSSQDIKRGRELFTQMAALTGILSIVLETFYTLKSMQEVDHAGQNGTRLILEKAKPVQITLKEWFTNLPISLKLDENMNGKPSSTGHLHLAYFATEITLHRCIIRSLTSNNADSYLTHVCRSAAKTRLISAMDFVNRLRPVHLSSFWYFPSRVNFALIGTFGSLLLATAPCQEEAEFYRTRLSEYRWTLCVSSRDANFLTFAISSLDSSANLLKGLPPKPSTSELNAEQPQILGHTTRLSPPQDEIMVDEQPLHLGQLRGLIPAEGTNSGLISPSTSTLSDSPTQQAYVSSFAHHMDGSADAGIRTGRPF